MAINRNGSIERAASAAAASSEAEEYRQNVRQVIADSPTFRRLLDVTPGHIHVSVHGHDAYVHAGAHCRAPHRAAALLQKFINEHTTDTPVTIHVIRQQ